MSLDENDLRRALEARSGGPTPEYRARLHQALAQPRPATNWTAVVAVFAVTVLTVVSIGILVAARTGRPQGGVASGARVATPTPAQTAGSVAGVLVPPPSPLYLPGTAQLSAPSSNVIWVLLNGQYLYRSTDQGKTWQQRPIPPATIPQPEISFIDDHEGWLATGGVPATQCTFAGTNIWHTTDAGASWQNLGSSGMRDAQCKQGLSFVDSTHGFLAAWDPNARPTIYRTSDGGRTWVGSTLPDPPDFVSQPGGFVLTAGLVKKFGNTLLVEAWGRQDGDVPYRQYVFRSTDGGMTWSFLVKAPNSADTLAFVTSTRWVLIVPGQSMETTTAGQQWHPYASDYQQAAGVPPQIVFADTQVGYTSVRGGIQRTVDGGAHWVPIKTPGVYQPG